ncbi:ATP-binding cassette domain-containing protein, partial [Vibrio parahaemolyticus]|nr:ATP-binding cassette domain-containing protein [Vibrio parahaemolyticus]
MENDVILSVKDPEVEFTTDDGPVKVLHGVNFDVRAGRTLGLVGESGSGKSVTSMSIMGLLPKPYGNIIKGEVNYRGTNLVDLPAEEMYAMRGDRISIIFQDPMTSLNPYMKVSDQLMEVLMLHKGMGKSEAFEESVRMLEAVKIPEARKRITMYPHEFSGGMRQRV